MVFQAFWALFVVFTVASGSSVGTKSIGMLVVYAMKRESEEAFCLGGIVSSRTVITTCSCVGKFLFEEADNYYIFKEFDSRNVVLMTYTEEMFEIEKSIINGHCMPSKWDRERLNYNLGGWKIENSFDLDKYAILHPLEKENNINFNIILDGKLSECHTVGYDKSSKKMLQSGIFVEKEQASCLNSYCGHVSKNKDVDCSKIQYSVLNGPNKCGYLDKGIQVDFMIGTPIYCHINGEYYVFGVGIEQTKTILFFTRIDTNPNYEFYKSVYMGTNLASDLVLSSSVRVLSALNLIFLIIILTPNPPT